MPHEAITLEVKCSVASNPALDQELFSITLFLKISSKTMDSPAQVLALWIFNQKQRRHSFFPPSVVLLLCQKPISMGLVEHLKSWQGTMQHTLYL
jgi:hypothetical protein